MEMNEKMVSTAREDGREGLDRKDLEQTAGGDNQQTVTAMNVAWFARKLKNDGHPREETIERAVAKYGAFLDRDSIIMLVNNVYDK